MGHSGSCSAALGWCAVQPPKPADVLAYRLRNLLVDGHSAKLQGRTCCIGAGPGGLRSVAAALEQRADDGEALLVRIAAGVYRERLVITRPVMIEAHPPVRPFLLSR